MTFSAVALIVMVANCANGKKQQIGVTGRVICPMDPAKAQNLEIRLINKNKGPDSVMGTTRTDAQGNFKLTGESKELIGNVDARLKINHQCNVGWIKGKVCSRRLAYNLPKKYLTEAKLGLSKVKFVNMGVINLEPEVLQEDSCNLT